jgi:adenosylhomocysteine nucleosidase
MPSELKAVVRAGHLQRSGPRSVFSHAGRVGHWRVEALTIGMGPALAREATRQALASGSFDHVLVVGIAGGLDPALPVGSLLVPARVRQHPHGPVYTTHPLPGRDAAGGLMTTDGLFDAEDVWRPILESGYGAVDMEASGVAEACEDAGVPWTVYRGISDRPDQHLVDQAVFGLSKPDGTPDLWAAARYVLGDPRRIGTLGRLNRDMQLAARVAAEAAFSDLSYSS